MTSTLAMIVKTQFIKLTRAAPYTKRKENKIGKHQSVKKTYRGMAWLLRLDDTQGRHRLGIFEDQSGSHLAARALDLLGNDDNLVDLLVADGVVMVAPGEELAVEVGAAHVAVELGRAVLERHDLAVRLLQVVVVLARDLPELLVLDVAEEGHLEVLGVVARDLLEVLHADLVERDLVLDGVGLFEGGLVVDEVALGVVGADVDVFLVAGALHSHLRGGSGRVDVEAQLSRLEVLELLQVHIDILERLFVDLVIWILADVQEGSILFLPCQVRLGRNC
ncbi:hypothetical protein PG995_013197 [Apiospora arundinis]